MALRGRKNLQQHKAHRIVTEPAVEPITLAEVRTLLREPPTDDDAFITLCIAQARSIFESVTGIACIDQVWKLTLDQWPNGREAWWDGERSMPITELYGGCGSKFAVTLPRFPLQTVDSVSTYDLTDTATATTVADVFYTDAASFPGRLVLRYGYSWPTALRRANGIEIQYTAGFGSSADDVPADIKRAIQQVAGYLYEHRGEGCTPSNALQKSGALMLASAYVSIKL